MRERTMPRRLAGVTGLLSGNALYRRYFLARWISVTGSTIAPLAAAFAVLNLGGGASGIGWVLVTGPVVYMAVSPIGGVVADRFPRLTVLRCCQVVSGTVQSISAVLVLTGTATIALLACLQLLAGAAGAFFQPAAQGLLPQIVDEHSLPDANALSQLANNMVAICGPSLAGVAIAAGGPGWVLGWDAASFYLSAALLSTVRVTVPARSAPAPFLTELVQGWRAFASRRWVWVIALLSATSSGVWAAGIAVLGPVYAKEHLGGAIAWGLINSSLGVGFAAGSILMLITRPRRAGLVCCAAMIPEICFLGSLAAGAPVLVIAAMAALAGAAGTIELITYSSLLQARLPQAQISRVLSTVGLVGTVFLPVAYLTVGPATAAFGTSAALWGCATIALIAAATAYAVRDVRHLHTGY